jgi:tetratricopeptide (TPR) repeat protein
MRCTLWNLAIGLALTFGNAQADNICGELTNGYGPFDHRERALYPAEFKLVEGAHFTTSVEQGVKGKTAEIGADLDYTLRAIPNHPRALASMGRLGLKNKSIQVQGARYPVECYFERALRFRPDDGAVRAVYGNYLFSMGRNEAAHKMFTSAVALMPDDPTINYNAGLAYFNAKDYVRANRHAQKAYALGFPLPGLKNKLRKAGKWNEKIE